MSLSALRKWNAAYAVVALGLCWVILPVYLKYWFYRGAGFFQAPVERGAAAVGELQDYWALGMGSKLELITRLRELERSESSYRFRLQERAHLEHYADRLERLLSLEPCPDHRLLHARVIRRDVNVWMEQVDLDRGLEDGVVAGLAVVTRFGLVGRVEQVRQRACTVRLMSSPAFRITVNALHDDRPMALQGMGQLVGQPIEADLRHVPQDLDCEQAHPIALYTTGLGGSIPANLLVGELIEVESEAQGLFQRGRVRLDEGLRSMREVAILIPLKQAN
jgi:rod shape-determining protein MreC